MNDPQQIMGLWQQLGQFPRWLLCAMLNSLGLQRSRLKRQMSTEFEHDAPLVPSLGCDSDRRDRYRAIIKAQTELICRFDPGGVLTFVNPAYCQYFQSDEAQLLGQNFLHVLSQRSVSETVKQFKALTPQDLTEFWEYQVLSPSGEPQWLQWTTRAILNDQNQVWEYQAVGRDISRYKLVEHALQRDAQRYQQMLETVADGIWLIDLEHRTTVINPKMAAMLGYPVAEIVGRSLFEFMDEEGLAIAAQNLQTQQVDTPQQYELKLCRKDGRSLWVIMSTTPNLDSCDRPVGLLGMLTDITERKKAEAILRESEERFRAIFEQAAVGMAILTPEGRFFRVNQKLCDLLGYSRLKMLTQTHAQLIHPDHLAQTLHADQQLIAGTDTYYTYPQQYRRMDKSWIWLNVTMSLIREANGEPKYFIGVMADISAEQAALRERAAAEESKRALLNAIPEIACLLDNQGIILQGNQALAAWVELPLNQLVGQALTQLITSPITDYDSYLVQACQARQVVKFMAYQGDRYFEHTIYPISDRQQQVQRLAFFALDLTDRKNAEQALQTANAQLTEKFHELELRHQEMVQLGRINGFLQVCTSVQEAYHAIADLLDPLFPGCSGMVFRIETAQQTAHTVAQWGEPTDHPKQFPANHCWSLRRGQPYSGNSAAAGLLCEHLPISTEPLTALCLPLMAQGETIGLLHLQSHTIQALSPVKQQLAHTVSEHLALALANLELRDTLKQQSIRDPLTGLYNRRYMNEALQQALHRAVREGQSVGVLMLDVDHFKQFNDTFGHEAGDLVLQALGRFLQEHIRGSDVPCRYGGEEMLLILAGASLETTQYRAEVLRQGVKQLCLHAQGQTLKPITISLGVACFPAHGETAEMLLQAADTALYEAKNQGRDRTVVYPSTPISA